MNIARSRSIPKSKILPFSKDIFLLGEAEKSGIRASRRSLGVFLEIIEWRIYNLIEQSVSYNLKYLQKKRRRLYFED